MHGNLPCLLLATFALLAPASPSPLCMLSCTCQFLTASVSLPSDQSPYPKPPPALPNRLQPSFSTPHMLPLGQPWSPCLTSGYIQPAPIPACGPIPPEQACGSPSISAAQVKREDAAQQSATTAFGPAASAAPAAWSPSSRAQGPNGPCQPAQVCSSLPCNGA